LPPIRIDNQTFRRALLSLNGLGSALPSNDPLPLSGDGTPSGDGVDWTVNMIRRLGFVQIDPIATVERAHHHILFSRNPEYRQPDLIQQLEQERTLFENWTHDAAIIPTEFYCYWKHYFERAKTFEAHPGYRRYFAPVTPKDTATVLRRIEREGPLKPRDFDTRKVAWKDTYFAKPTIAKLAIELLWRTGKLAVSHRDGQQKVYDLAQRVIPESHFRRKVSFATYVDWTCGEALKRLGVGTPLQVARFFDAISHKEAAAWCQRHVGRKVCEAQVVQADGSLTAPAFALTSVVDAMRNVGAPPRRLRLINPFDPLIHDRQRTQRVFGFDYAVEIWVPPKKRRYGYYVLPILEGDRFTGRVDAKCDRRGDRIAVLGLWWEEGVETSKTRERRLEQALQRLARFVGVGDVTFAKECRRRSSPSGR
jgi:uncharacterized protein